MYNFRKYDIKTIEKDFENLLNYECKKNFKYSLYGNKVVDFYTFHIRLETKGTKNVSFNDAMKDKKIKNKLKNLLIKHNNKLTLSNYHEKYRMTFDSISSFRPSLSKQVYCKFNPKVVLDFSMGWGGRLLGILSLGIDYIGFDTNKKLKIPLKNMVKRFNIYKSDIKLIFKDSSKINFDKYNYDMILSSPPYYNKEKYYNMPKYKDFDDFVDSFFKIVIKNSYDGLKKNGWFCINVNEILYKIMKNIIGRKEDIRININLKSFNFRSPKYKEYIYCWHKINK